MISEYQEQKRVSDQIDGIYEGKHNNKEADMDFEYKTTHEFKAEDLKDLFLSVEWSSGHYPERLAVAMRNFKSVFSAWDEDKLIGMVCDEHGQEKV